MQGRAVPQWVSAVCAIMLAGLFFHCDPSSGPYVQDDRYRFVLRASPWRLISSRSEQGVINTDTSAQKYTIAFNDTTVSGHEDCNVFGARYTSTAGGEISFSQTGKTEMACPSSILWDYTALLSRCKVFVVDSAQLTLADRTGTVQLMFQRSTTW